MSKVLLTSDIHLFDYSGRNPSNRFRLYQTRTIAQNIIEVGKNEECDYLVLAGDIVERPIMPGYIQLEVKRFLDAVSSNFKNVFLIWGQHDRSSRSNDALLEDSVISVMMPPNCQYMDRQIINLEGNRIGFASWVPKFDLGSWIDEPVDILISHATINYDENNTAFQSQELDLSKFKIAFLGDIHKAVSRNFSVPGSNEVRTLVSIGVPVRNKMGDSEDSTGVVLDLQTHKWDWVCLDPHNLLLRYTYTNDLDKEGYDPATNTWSVYKPDNVFSQGNNNIKVDTWSEIEALVEDAVVKSGLQEIHTEVLKNIGTSEDFTEFNFVIKSLHLENWRSIENATIKFNKGDKIYLAGANGSGKSSLLSGLKYAFMDVSTTQGLLSLKPFIQHGKSYCLTEVEFSFQGNEYRLRRGTNSKDNALWINGEEQKYNSKRAFEEDVRNRFKFIEFLSESMLFDADHHRFIGMLTPERKTQVMSRYLKLDRIDILHNTSQLMLDEVKKERSGWTSKINETQKLLSYIQDKLNLIIIPELSRQQLESLKQEGMELQRKNKLWNEYQNKSANLQGKIQTYTSTIQSLQEKQAGFRSQAIIDSEISSINQEIQNLNARLVDLGNIRVNLEYKTRELGNLKTQGNNYWLEAKELGVGKRCSTCGQVIQNTVDMEAHRQELLRKVEEMKPQVQALQQEVNELTYLMNNSSQEYDQTNSRIRELNSEVSKRMAEKSLISSTQRDIQTYNQLLLNAQSELSSLGVVERIDLPSDFLDRMSAIESGIGSWIQYESGKLDLEIKTKELTNLTAEVEKMDQYLAALEAYSRLTGPVGIIYEEIINKLKDAFSDNNVAYKVVRSGKGAREHLDLLPVFKKGKEEIEYSFCSSGEKTLLDIHLLDKLISSAGLLVLDETLKNLDPERLSEIAGLLKDFDVNLLILTSHSESINGFYNRVINLSINSEGLTEIN